MPSCTVCRFTNVGIGLPCCGDGALPGVLLLWAGVVAVARGVDEAGISVTEEGREDEGDKDGEGDISMSSTGI